MNTRSLYKINISFAARALVFVAIVLALFLANPSFADARALPLQCYNFGDVDHSGAIGTLDTDKINQYLFFGVPLSETEKYRADVNDSGSITNPTVDVGDRDMIADYYNFLRDTFPVCTTSKWRTAFSCSPTGQAFTGSSRDVNVSNSLDDKVALHDVLKILEYEAGLIPSSDFTTDEFEQADVYQHGHPAGGSRISSTDALILKQYLADLIDDVGPCYKCTTGICANVGDVLNGGVYTASNCNNACVASTPIPPPTGAPTPTNTPAPTSPPTPTPTRTPTPTPPPPTASPGTISLSGTAPICPGPRLRLDWTAATSDEGFNIIKDGTAITSTLGTTWTSGVETPGVFHTWRVQGWPTGTLSNIINMQTPACTTPTPIPPTSTPTPTRTPTPTPPPPTPTSPPTYSISGKVYVDSNSNGVQDCSGSCTNGSGDELNYQGATVSRSGSASTATTNSSGNYTFSGLLPGLYTITLTVPAGYTATTSNPVGASVGPSKTVNFGIIPSVDCSDGIDNDGDTLIDSADPGCHTDGDPGNPGSYDPSDPSEMPECSDAIDNDGDTLIDSADPDCHTDGDPGNPGSYDPNLPSENPLDLSGSVIIDSAGNNCASGTTPYTGGASVTTYNSGGSETGSDTTDGSGSYLTSDSTAPGQKTAVLSNIADYQVRQVRFDNGAWTTSGLSGYTYGPFDFSANHTLDFCVNNATPWFQTTTGDARMSSITNKVPAGQTASIDPSSPSVFYSSSFNSNFGAGSASQLGWKVDDEYSYQANSKNVNGTASYSFYASRIAQTNIATNSIPGCTGGDCETGISNLATGAYHLNDGNLTITSYSHGGGAGVNDVVQRGSVTTDKDSSGNVTIAKPEGVQSGDFLGVWICHDNSSETITPVQSGWTDAGVGSQDGSDCWLLYKNAGGAEPSSYQFNFGDPDDAFVALMFAYYNSGGGIVSYDKGVNLYKSITSSPTTLPSITTANNNSMLLGFVNNENLDLDNQCSSWASPFVELADIGTQDDIGTAFGAGVQATAGPSGTKSVTCSPSDGGGFIAAIYGSGSQSGSGGDRVLLLVNGDVTIKSNISVPIGSLLIVAAKGDIIVDKAIGTTTLSSTTPAISGIFTAQGSFIADGDGCPSGIPDRRLNIQGSIIANSLKPFNVGGGGAFVNRRSLCLSDQSYPSVYVDTRLDFVTQLTNFYKTAFIRWRELAP